MLEGPPRSSVEEVDTAQEDRSGARGAPCTVLDEEGYSLERESRNSVAGDAVKRYITMPSRHQRSSGSSATLYTHHIN